MRQAFKLILVIIVVVVAVVVLREVVQTALIILHWYINWLLVIKTVFALLLGVAARAAVQQLHRTEQVGSVKEHGKRHAVEAAQTTPRIAVMAIYLPSLTAWFGVLHGVVLEAASPWWFAAPSIGLSAMVLVTYGFYLELRRDISRVGTRPPRVIWSPKSIRR